MTSTERLQELQVLKVEFYDDKTTDNRRVEILEQVRVWAAEETSGRCGLCTQAIISIPYPYALIEGHCYSAQGTAEFHITGTCEYCFDKIHADPDDESIPAVGPR